ncbi:hypothetical protein EVG20_g4004 [Dentipellis fragilis]|uniref:DUF6533 domain-containing protein n=1 Tax=Dentipellis fragilis TaxID=205917 RepID=A0A4Y9YY10_9AGAM|nr:hypothetical protein EVG20_g4004 [Dentipellis fragilis]
MTSVLGPEVERELISAIQSTYATRYLSAIGLVALIYDHILTLPDEIRLIWKAPRSFAKWAFLANRYIVALCLILVANELCGFNMFEFSTQIIVRTAIIGFVLTTMSTVGTMIGAVIVLAPSVQWNPVVQTCVVTTTTSWYIAVWIPPMVYELLIFGLSAYSSLSRPRSGNAKMANILHEDGLLFFLALLILRLLNIGFAAKGDPSRIFMVSYFVWSLFTITLSRCLLSIRASEVALARSPNAPEDPCVGLFSMTGRASPIQVELGDWDPLESPALSEKALERLPARRLQHRYNQSIMSFDNNLDTDHVRGLSKHTRNAVEPTDESQTFKKAEQVVGRPPVSDESVNDTYLRSPPQNLDPSLSSDRQARGLKRAGESGALLQRVCLATRR